MIKMFGQDDGLGVPLLVCDVCGKKIDIHKGVAFYDFPDSGQVTEVIHAHGGKCYDIAATRFGEPPASMNIKDHIVQLIDIQNTIFLLLTYQMEHLESWLS